MNSQELANRLAQIGMPTDAYCLTGGLPHEAYCLNQTTAGWEVYYSERGSKTGLVLFTTEAEACLYLYQRLINEVRH
ncbi:hypothetical protein GCM10028805_17660 [Spirosoma harenae]